MTNAFDAAERQNWAGQAAAYAAGFAHLCAHPVPALLDAARVAPGARVLDVGTGPGTVAAAAAARGAHVTAVDAEPDMVVRAAAAVPEAVVRQAALPQLPYEDGQFDCVLGNFVLNHVGRPRRALAELRRVTRPGGRIALTIWATPPAPGQALLGRAVAAAGVERPAHLPSLPPEEDFPRTPEGFAALLREGNGSQQERNGPSPEGNGPGPEGIGPGPEGAGLGDVRCAPLSWEHRTAPDTWWRGPAAGVATIGRMIAEQPPAVVARIRSAYTALSREFAAPDGTLYLPHTALLAYGTA